jgi:hypothetical protein
MPGRNGKPGFPKGSMKEVLNTPSASVARAKRFRRMAEGETSGFRRVRSIPALFRVPGEVVMARREYARRRASIAPRLRTVVAESNEMAGRPGVVVVMPWNSGLSEGSPEADSKGSSARCPNLRSIPQTHPRSSVFGTVSALRRDGRCRSKPGLRDRPMGSGISLKQLRDVAPLILPVMS